MASSEIIVSKEGCSIGLSDADDDFDGNSFRNQKKQLGLRNLIQASPKYPVELPLQILDSAPTGFPSHRVRRSAFPPVGSSFFGLGPSFFDIVCRHIRDINRCRPPVELAPSIRLCQPLDLQIGFASRTVRRWDFNCFELPVGSSLWDELAFPPIELAFPPVELDIPPGERAFPPVERALPLVGWPFPPVERALPLVGWPFPPVELDINRCRPPVELAREAFIDAWKLVKREELFRLGLEARWRKRLPSVEDGHSTEESSPPEEALSEERRNSEILLSKEDASISKSDRNGDFDGNDSGCLARRCRDVVDLSNDREDLKATKLSSSPMPECFNDVKNSGICPGERTHRVRGWTPPSTPIWSQKSEKSLDPTEAAIAADQVSPTPTGYSQMLRENGKNVITGSSKEPAWRPALKARRGDECSSKLQGEFPPPSDESHPKKQMKNLGLVAAVIFAANCSTIMSAGKQREAAGQSVLIASMLSLMLALLLILASIGVPKLSYSSAKIVGLFSALLTAFSYLTFLAIQLGSISKDTVCMVSVAAFVFSATIIFLTCTTKMKCAPAALVGADLV